MTFLCRQLLLLGVPLLGIVQAHAGLVAHYAFDETSGTTAADSSGSGNTGTLHRGGSTPWVSGRIGNALSIDSVTNGYVRATGYKGVTGTNARSLAYWTKTTAPNTYDYAVHWGGVVPRLRSGHGLMVGGPRWTIPESVLGMQGPSSLTMLGTTLFLLPLQVRRPARPRYMLMEPL